VARFGHEAAYVISHSNADMDDPIVQNPGHWVMVNAVNAVDGSQRVVMRLRIDRPTDSDIDSYATAVVIGWEFPLQDGTASPPHVIYQKMLSFERALDELSMENGHSYLMNVGTGLGLREWCYYTKDKMHFMRRFNELLAGRERYPLKIEFYDDPEWEVWRDLRSAYERAGGEPAARVNKRPADPGR
jgi:hypothetical protein